MACRGSAAGLIEAYRSLTTFRETVVRVQQTTRLHPEAAAAETPDELMLKVLDEAPAALRLPFPIARHALSPAGSAPADRQRRDDLRDIGKVNAT